MRYGMPYKGSKNAIAEKLIEVLPPAEHFYDLFGGGGAMSHCALLSVKYKHVHYNELDPLVFKGFKMAVNGEFKNENRWISREDFNRLKDTDPYVAICFSFGNDLSTYCYSREIEPFKKALHNAIVLHNFTELNGILAKNELELVNTRLTERKDITRAIKNVLHKHACSQNTEIQKLLRALERLQALGCLESLKRLQALGCLESLKRLQALGCLESLKRLQALGCLESLKRLQALGCLESLKRLQALGCLESLKRLQALGCLESLERLDYQDVKIEPNSVIYCDIPYKSTNKYRIPFDYDRFYKWANKQDNIFISEYEMPDNFIELHSFKKYITMGTNNKSHGKDEKLFTNHKTFELLNCNNNVLW